MADVGIDVAAEQPKILTNDTVRRFRDEIRYGVETLISELH
jgi:hypothetical protein